MEALIDHAVVSNNPLAVYGLADFWPQFVKHTQETIIAVNVGDCVIPVGLCVYEMSYLATFDPRALALGVVGCLITFAQTVGYPTQG